MGGDSLRAVVHGKLFGPLAPNPRHADGHAHGAARDVEVPVAPLALGQDPLAVRAQLHEATDRLEVVQLGPTLASRVILQQVSGLVRTQALRHGSAVAAQCELVSRARQPQADAYRADEHL